MRVLAIGDIHTKIWIVDKVIRIINNYDYIVFLGDYADDWEASPQDNINTWMKLKKLHEDYSI